MEYKDYNPKKPPQINFLITENSILQLIAAFSPDSNHNKLYKLNALYDWCEIILEDVRRQAVCKEGCFHCCAQKVAVSPIEIKNIQNNLGKFIPRDNGNYCPLLDMDEGKCGVYTFRPLVCRTMLTFDNPKYCESNEEHFTFDFAQFHKKISEMFLSLGKPGKMLIQNINELLRDEESDLREFFKIK